VPRAALAAVALFSVGCGGVADEPTGSDDGSASGEIVVFAAASLTEAFTEIGDVFEAAHPDTSVTFNFAASSELVAQILEGAPADVYASADLANMAKLTTAGANASEPVVFATNLSEIVVAEGNPLGITGVADLAEPDLVLVVCTPEAPCGSYAEQVFTAAGVDATPDSYESNPKAVVTKIRLGEADVGIAYATDVAAANDDVDGVPIPDEQNVVAEYPIAVTAESRNPSTATAFVELVLDTPGQAVLSAHGFASP
jgi:molybdate transport system substrate-binding protein